MKTLFTGIRCPDQTFVHTPLIEIRPVRDNGEIKQVALEMERYDYLLYTSQNAVTHFLPQSQHVRIVSIGDTTSEALRQAGATEIEQVEQDNSYGVIDWFARQPRGSVLIPRSNLALSLIPKGLRNLGFEATTVTAYENHMPEEPQKVDLSQIDKIVFTSPSTIDNFIILYGSLPKGKQFITRGPITEQYLQNKIKRQNHETIQRIP